jgi:integrase
LQELKTDKSRRTLALPDVCVTALRAHRTRQLEERLKAGARWVETGLVFTTYRTYGEGRGQGRKVGTGPHPRNVLRVLYDLLDAAELPRVRFHDLRHSAASLLIAAGVQLAEVSMLLGHSELPRDGRLLRALAERDRGESGAAHGRPLQSSGDK